MTKTLRAAEGRMACTKAASDHQKAWFAEFQQRALKDGEPYVIADGAAPHEICHVMDIPVVSTVWYSAIIAAKKLSPHYFNLAEDLGYHDRLPRYVSLPLFSTLDNNPDLAPYGGLPKPLLLLSRFRGDYNQRIFERWADAYGVPHYPIDCSSIETLGDNWWRENNFNWEEFFGPHRFPYQVQQLEGLIRFIEGLTGRVFDHEELALQMNLSNELCEVVAEVADMVAKARPCPVSMPEQLHNVMTPTWHRGSQWSVDHLRAYRDEVKQRIDDGVVVCPDEKIRLLWLNNGLWFDTGFYRAFEEKYGAVFVWSMYTNFIADGYRRYFDDDPLKALAARHLTVNEQLHLPHFMNDWVVKQAEDFGGDAAVLLISEGDRAQATAANFTRLALERAGVPVLTLHANTVDERLWDAAKMNAMMEDFLENRVIPNQAAKKAAAEAN